MDEQLHSTASGFSSTISVTNEEQEIPSNAKFQDSLSTQLQCISPETKLAFPVGEPTTSELQEENPEILPSDDWEFQAESTTGLPFVSKLFFRTNTELWIESDGDAIYKYLIDSKEWIPYKTVGDYDIRINNVFISNKDGAVWGYNHHTYQNIPKNQIPVLSRYDEPQDKFVPVLDVDGILTAENVTSLNQQPSVDADGIIWMVLSIDGQDFIYSFNPSTLVAEEKALFSNSPWITGLTHAPDGNVWMIDYHNGQLLYYDVHTESIQIFTGIPDGEVGISSEEIKTIFVLFADSNERLWISDAGWLDFSNLNSIRWYKVIRSPVFVEKHLAPNGYYHWNHPDLIFQSSNNRYWFSSSAGVVMLDAENTNWCLITTGYSAVTEDTSGNIWMVVFDKVYKLSQSK
ncbi:MAG: hypothetical protein GY792_28155 [Gammaproteobacteria bacterium]|nr:hypothetical protein [Gammaproteobacteria bacterium]